MLGLQTFKATCDLARCVSPGSAVIVRSGASGAWVCQKKMDGQCDARFVPAYYGKDRQEKVVDPTGMFVPQFEVFLTGHNFLGNEAVGTPSLEASVPASFSRAEALLTVCIMIAPGRLYLIDCDLTLTAALHGMVAASFAIEQNGPPRVTQVDGEREMWNEADAQERLRDLYRWTEGV